MVGEAGEIAWLRFVPALPLLTATLLGLGIGLFRWQPARGFLQIWCGASLLGSFAFAGVGFARLVGEDSPERLVDSVATWIGVGVGQNVFSADLALQLDPLSAVLVLLVIGLGFVVQVYSTGYLEMMAREDGGAARYFALLQLYIAAMSVLLMADNLLLLIAGWELAALGSALLVGYWYGEEEPGRAGVAVFVMQRVGDAGLLMGSLLLFWAMSEAGVPSVELHALALHFDEIVEMRLPGSDWPIAGAVSALFFLAACAKASQLPFLWLPRAALAPAPAAGLVHATTLAAAGVYLVCRFSYLHASAPIVGQTVAWLGGITALLAAFATLAQTDLLKLLLYSALTQLGFVFVALGSFAYTAAVYHTLTHAFFQTLLFLCAGALIASLRGRRDLREMGGIRGKLPRIHAGMWIGVLSLVGLPPLSGFFSRDAVLSAAYAAGGPDGSPLWTLGVVTSGIVSLAMFRMLFLAFHGQTRVPPERRMTLRDPQDGLVNPIFALWPLAIFGWLAGPSQFWGDVLVGGVEGADSLGRFLSQVVATPGAAAIPAAAHWQLVAWTLLSVLLGLGLAWQLYLVRPELTDRVTARLGWWTRRFVEQPLLERAIEWLVVKPVWGFARVVLDRGIEQQLLERGILQGSMRMLRGVSERGLRRLHDGLVPSAFVAILLGAVAAVAWLVYGGVAS